MSTVPAECDILLRHHVDSGLTSGSDCPSRLPPIQHQLENIKLELLSRSNAQDRRYICDPSKIRELSLAEAVIVPAPPLYQRSAKPQRQVRCPPTVPAHAVAPAAAT